MDKPPSRSRSRAETVAKPANVSITLNVNGVPSKLTIAPWTTLLDALRDRLNLTGTKKGCDHGQCGACTVLVDGRRVNSCLTLAIMKDGASITTVEGLAANGSLHPLQQAFIDHDAFQCGLQHPWPDLLGGGPYRGGQGENCRRNPRDRLDEIRCRAPMLSVRPPRGDAAKAFAAAAVRHEAEYFIPIEHHNPMELFAATAVWNGDGKLTVYDKTQGVQNVQRYLCSVFGLNSDDLRVVSPYVGGAFGSGLRPQYEAVLAVQAALKLKRSVRLVLAREHMYGLGYRPATIERVAIGARPDGMLDAITHEAVAMTSQYEEFARNDTSWSALLYKSPNARYEHKLARLDVPTPFDMRAPGARRGFMRWNARWTSSRLRSKSIRSNCASAAIRTATRTPTFHSPASS